MMDGMAPNAPGAPRGWEGLAREQVRMLYALVRLLVLCLVALLGRLLFYP